jgi:hypothetical protein
MFSWGGKIVAIILDLSNIERERALNCWLAYQGIRRIDLARSIGVDASFITRIVQGKRPSQRLHKALIEYGLPEELLPKPNNGPGRPPKISRQKQGREFGV